MSEYFILSIASSLRVERAALTINLNLRADGLSCSSASSHRMMTLETILSSLDTPEEY